VRPRHARAAEFGFLVMGNVRSLRISWSDTEHLIHLTLWNEQALFAQDVGDQSNMYAIFQRGPIERLRPAGMANRGITVTKWRVAPTATAGCGHTSCLPCPILGLNRTFGSAATRTPPLGPGTAASSVRARPAARLRYRPDMDSEMSVPV
jgi:hypothetical protein